MNWVRNPISAGEHLDPGACAHELFVNRRMDLGCITSTGWPFQRRFSEAYEFEVDAAGDKAGLECQRGLRPVGGYADALCI